jgi:hypothetical protein
MSVVDDMQLLGFRIAVHVRGNGISTAAITATWRTNETDFVRQSGS